MADEFINQLPEDLRGNESLKSFKTVGDLAKSFVETKALVGNSMRLPGDNAKPEDWDSVYKKLGWPEKPDGYSKLDKASLPEGVELDEKFMNDFYAFAHKHRLNGRQANELLKDLNTRQLDVFKEHAKTQEAADTEAEKRLDSVLGQSKQSRLEQARRFIAHFASKEMLDKIDSMDWGSDPDFLLFIDKLAGQWTEDHSITRNRGINPLVNSPEQIRAKISELMANPIYMNGNAGKKHLELVQEVRNLYKMLPDDEKKA